MTEPLTMKAVGAFNPTARPIGFLQPLFAGGHGDNQTYIQRLEGWSRIGGFDAVAWPERDTVTFADPTAATLGGESLWAFQFPDEPLLLLPWEDFRTAMAGRTTDAVLADRPLLLFDIVQTLGLEDQKPETFDRAFHAYARAGRAAAERWRDKEILEPRLLDALLRDAARAPSDSEAIPIRHIFQARIVDGAVRVAMRGGASPAVSMKLERAYREILTRFPDIFPRGGRVEIENAPFTPAPFKQETPEPAAVTVVLVGKLCNRQLTIPGLDPRSSTEILDIDDLPMHRRRVSQSQLYLLVGTQSEWRVLAAAAEQLSDLPAVAVMLTVSSAPLLRDVEFQGVSPLPSVSIFTPSGSREHGDALRPLQPLIDILIHTERPRKPVMDRHGLPARHNLLLRADVRTARDAAEVCCRLGARALRSGIRPGARADVFIERPSHASPLDDYGRLFGVLFASGYPTQIDVPPSAPTLSRRLRHLTLLVERNDMGPRHVGDHIIEGVERLFAMRGWQAKREGAHFQVSDEHRQFSAIVVERKEEIPAEEGQLARPGFGRAPLLVIHVAARREALLIGNRGEYCHIALDDIGQMRPGTPWIWPVLRRQLMIPSARPMLAALRLAAAIAAEAIRLDRYELLSEGWSMGRILSALEAKDCERFLDFAPNGITRREILLHLRLPQSEEAADDRPDPILRLRIDDDGPTLLID